MNDSVSLKFSVTSQTTAEEIQAWGKSLEKAGKGDWQVRAKEGKGGVTTLYLKEKTGGVFSNWKNTVASRQKKFDLAMGTISGKVAGRLGIEADSAKEKLFPKPQQSSSSSSGREAFTVRSLVSGFDVADRIHAEQTYGKLQSALTTNPVRKDSLQEEIDSVKSQLSSVAPGPEQTQTFSSSTTRGISELGYNDKDISEMGTQINVSGIRMPVAYVRVLGAEERTALEENMRELKAGGFDEEAVLKELAEKRDLDPGKMTEAEKASLLLEGQVRSIDWDRIGVTVGDSHSVRIKSGDSTEAKIDTLKQAIADARGIDRSQVSDREAFEIARLLNSQNIAGGVPSGEKAATGASLGRSPVNPGETRMRIRLDCAGGADAPIELKVTPPRSYLNAIQFRESDESRKINQISLAQTADGDPVSHYFQHNNPEGLEGQTLFETRSEFTLSYQPPKGEPPKGDFTITDSRQGYWQSDSLFAK